MAVLLSTLNYFFVYMLQLFTNYLYKKRILMSYIDFVLFGQLFSCCYRQKILTAEEARTMSNDIMNELVTYNQSMEADVAKQEAALHKRLSDAKKKKLAAKVRK